MSFSNNNIGGETVSYTVDESPSESIGNRTTKTIKKVKKVLKKGAGSGSKTIEGSTTTTTTTIKRTSGQVEEIDENRTERYDPSLSKSADDLDIFIDKMYCQQCDDSLAGHRYVLRDDRPYCIKCYENVFANNCDECGKIIGVDSKDLSHKDRHWHELCFACHKCRAPLADKQFGTKADRVYCSNCYDAQFAPRCDACNDVFKAGMRKMEYKTRQWHEKCFVCCDCKKMIGTKSFIPKEMDTYCVPCYEDKFATKCTKCTKVISQGGVTYRNEPWHRECFVCTSCSDPLATQRFTSRDDKPYCGNCFTDLFSRRCTKCSQPITGPGGFGNSKFVAFEQQAWHHDCFICVDCETSMVGRGFIQDAKDGEICCPDCARTRMQAEMDEEAAADAAAAGEAV